MRMALACCGALCACGGSDAVVGPHFQYAITDVRIPATFSGGKAFALDLNGDGVVDNQLGGVLGVLAEEMFGDPQAATNRALADGTFRMIVDLQTNDPSFSDSADVAATTYLGVVGSIDDTSPRLVPLVGSADHRFVDAGPGALTLEFAALGAPLQLELYGARMVLVSGPGHIDGVLAGVVPITTVRERLIPTWKVTLDAIIARDCVDLATPPVCGCVYNSAGLTAIHAFDVSRDCVVTVDEILGNSFVVSLTAPDVTIDGEPGLSFGMGISGDGRLVALR